MILKTEIDPENLPSRAGEILRNHFFDQTDGLGCYSTFEVKPNFAKLQEIPVEKSLFADDDDLDWFRYIDPEQHIEMRWYWNGDGTLVFIFSDNSCITNTDCKKDYDWQYYSSYEKFLDENKPLGSQ